MKKILGYVLFYGVVAAAHADSGNSDSINFLWVITKSGG